MPTPSALPLAVVTQEIRILGVDPGLRHTGWGIVTTARLEWGAHLSSLFRPRSHAPLDGELAQRLFWAIHRGLSEVVPHPRAGRGRRRADLRQSRRSRDAEAGPGAGLSSPFWCRPKPALPSRRVRAEPGQEDDRRRRPCREAADPGGMVSRVLPSPAPYLDSDDAADALAVAICHAHHRVARVPLKA